MKLKLQTSFQTTIKFKSGTENWVIAGRTNMLTCWILERFNTCCQTVMFKSCSEIMTGVFPLLSLLKYVLKITPGKYLMVMISEMLVFTWKLISSSWHHSLPIIHMKQWCLSPLFFSTGGSYQSLVHTKQELYYWLTSTLYLIYFL